ncbi:hypothetical protein HQ945_05540 [Phyllobacterium sp. BT25]|uniref:ASCH domain-containing protein n=1 Tax=Phyllobacterium pellucidum TaxID=2740464 RepID=A0A849VRI9_9HYPH|nr:hypothetical protein [Phyllobacterium pellucidum]NTS30710.1 hypothetical protein [Phyllobacterium pellucidum]
MADRPILFSAPMVQALLAGRKTQTRRIIKPRGHASLFDGSWTDDYVLDPGNASWRAKELRFCIGDRLYVREHWRTWSTSDHLPPSQLKVGTAVDYIVDGADVLHGKHRQAMHMPRWASRLTLLVTDVRVERLQDCSEADALAEGVERIVFPERGDWGWPQRKYRKIWENINGAGSWEANPWVVAVSFDVLNQNIDEVP